MTKYSFIIIIGTKNVVKGVKKVSQGPVKAEGTSWFGQLADKRKTTSCGVAY